MSKSKKEKSNQQPKENPISEELLKRLMGLPDLFYIQDMNILSKARLLATMEALDDTSDFINDYLTDEGFGAIKAYPDIDPDQVH